MASPDNTIIHQGGSFTDAQGNIWSINPNAQVTVNGQLAGFTAGVIEMAFEQGNVWQENNQGLWWQWNPAAPDNNTGWSPRAGTTKSPVVANNTKIVVTAGKTVNTAPNDDGSYVIQPGGVLNVTNGLGANSLIVDNGGTVIFNSPAKESGDIFVLDKGILVFGDLKFISAATSETIKVDGVSTLGIANMPNSEPAAEFLWGTHITAHTPDPTAGSFNIAFADLMGGASIGLNVGLLGSEPNSLPQWTFSQVGIPGSSFSGIFTANDLVPPGAINQTPNPTFTV